MNAEVGKPVIAQPVVRTGCLWRPVVTSVAVVMMISLGAVVYTFNQL